MKKIILSLIALETTQGINAQAIKIYDNKGNLVNVYNNGTGNKYKLVMTQDANGTIDGHEFVDLGLPSGTLWAKTNIGADTETDAGLYFAWGETTGYTSDTSDGRSFDEANYKWMASGYSDWKGCTKYTFADGLTNGCWYSNGTYVGTTVDGTAYTNFTRLESSDDAATVSWGSNWQMPTTAQMQELVDKTDCSWTKVNGIYGYKFANKSNASMYIFLPAVGYRSDSDLKNEGVNGSYWSSSLGSYYSYSAWEFFFSAGNVGPAYGNNRFYGHSVRAVLVK